MWLVQELITGAVPRHWFPHSIQSRHENYGKPADMYQYPKLNSAHRIPGHGNERPLVSRWGIPVPEKIWI